jgi:hypothetical protein
VKTPRNARRLAISTVVGLGLALIVVGLGQAVTGRDAQRLPDEIATITPGPGDTVLRQSQISVDFFDPYDAVLIVDGIELPVTRLDDVISGPGVPKPGSQIDLPPTAIYDAGNFTISFTPQEGAPVEQLKQGLHKATVIYWKIDESRNESKFFTWEFTSN